MNRLVISQRAAVQVAVFLAIVVCVVLLYAGSHAPVPRHSVLIDDCALVMTRDGGQTCR